MGTFVQAGRAIAEKTPFGSKWFLAARRRLVLAPKARAIWIAADGLALATRRYRAGDAVAARRLADRGALRAGIDADEALDILWFYLGYAGFFTLVDDDKWSYTKAERWLCAAVSQALLEPLHDNAGSAARSEKTRATRGGLSAKRRPTRPE